MGGSPLTPAASMPSVAQDGDASRRGSLGGGGGGGGGGGMGGSAGSMHRPTLPMPLDTALPMPAAPMLKPLAPVRPLAPQAVPQPTDDERSPFDDFC